MTERDPRALREAVTRAAEEGSVARLTQCVRLLLEVDSSAGTLRFLSRIANAAADGKLALKPLRVGLLSSYSIEFARDALVAHALAEGIRVELYQGGFGSFRQEVLDPNSGLHAFAPQAIVLAVEPDAWIGDGAGLPAVQALLNEVESLVRKFRERSSAAILCHNFAPPRWPAAPAGQEGAPVVADPSLILECNLGLQKLASAHSGFFIVDYATLVARAGHERWFDDRMRLYARAPIAQGMYPLLAREYVRFLRGLSGLTRKCLVVDLDNTLWGGVLGEDGVDGVKLGPDYPGAAFLQFQRFILQLHARGVLLAIASKNNPEDVQQMFADHRFMALKPEHFSSQQIGWHSKSESLRAIARQLNIGLEHMVFVDDSAFECEHVRETLPEVTVIQLPSEPARYIDALARDGLFDALSISDEDRRRGELYKQREQAESLRSSTGNLEDFYRELQMEVTIAPVDGSSLKRAAQLTQKTNQFNVTTRRYTETDVERLMADPDWTLLTVSVKDKFGDNGIVGVMFAARRDAALEIDTLLLSCRVIGRTVETAMLARLCEVARDAGLGNLIGSIIPTQKNVPVRDLFERHGFAAVSTDEQGASTWQLPLESGGVKYPEWLRISVTASAQSSAGEKRRVAG